MIIVSTPTFTVSICLKLDAYEYINKKKVKAIETNNKTLLLLLRFKFNPRKYAKRVYSNKVKALSK